MLPDRFAVDVAREALRRLSKQGLAPTPENYATLWHEVAGDAKSERCARADECEACSSLASMLRLTAQCVGTSAVQGGWVQGELERIVSQVVPPWEAERIKALEGPLAEVLGAESAMRSELANAKAGIKEILATLIGRIGALSDSTGDFAEKVDHYAHEIERADGIEALAKLARGLSGDTRAMKGNLEQTRQELVAAQERARGQDARVRDLEEQLAHAREQVRTDALTGALNRRGFDEGWEREVARVARTGEGLCLVVLDLDNFKALNDRYGHGVGDRALAHLTVVTRQIVRPMDLVARLGGEEFAILFTGVSIDEAAAITARLQRRLTRDFFLGGDERLFLTFSGGVAEVQPGETREDALNRADQALYEAKRAGKNRIVKAATQPAIAA